MKYARFPRDCDLTRSARETIRKKRKRNTTSHRRSFDYFLGGKWCETIMKVIYRNKIARRVGEDRQGMGKLQTLSART